MAILDLSYQPTCEVINVGTWGESRLRTVWAGDDDQGAQGGDLLNSFRNRANLAGVGGYHDLPLGITENWQCWRAGKWNNSTLWHADITLWSITPTRHVPFQGGVKKLLGHDNRDIIKSSVNEHFTVPVLWKNELPALVADQ